MQLLGASIHLRTTRNGLLLRQRAGKLVFTDNRQPMRLAGNDCLQIMAVKIIRP